MEHNTQPTTQESNGIRIDLQVIFNAILHNLLKIVIVTVLFGSISLGFSMFFMEPTYRATASVYINNRVIVDLDAISPNDLKSSKDLVNSYKVVLLTRDTLNAAIELGDLHRTPAQLKGMITASSAGDTQVMNISVSGTNPVEVADIANALADVVPSIGKTVEGSSAHVIEYAVVPSAPYSPNHFKNVVYGATIGLLLTVVAVTSAVILDLTIRDEDDIQHYCKYPLLATIPDMVISTSNSDYYYQKRYYRRNNYYVKNQNSANNSDDGVVTIGSKINFTALESYKLLRAKLFYSFSDDKNCHVIAVSSSLAGEGKSLTCSNLAYSLAQLNKRVLLIDCDMRRPSIAKKLSLSKYPGISEHLTGFLGLNELIQVYSDSEDKTQISVITAGTTPPNPVELLNSEKMYRAIETLREKFDYIVLDMPPVCDVSDALSAAKLADGVLMIIRQNYGSGVALRDAIQQFEFVNARILGCVLNCATGRNGKYQSKIYGKRYHYRYGRRYAYYYEKHYSKTEGLEEENQPLKKSANKKKKS